MHDWNLSIRAMTNNPNGLHKAILSAINSSGHRVDILKHEDKGEYSLSELKCSEYENKDACGEHTLTLKMNGSYKNVTHLLKRIGETAPLMDIDIVSNAHFIECKSPSVLIDGIPVREHKHIQFATGSEATIDLDNYNCVFKIDPFSMSHIWKGKKFSSELSDCLKEKFPQIFKNKYDDKTAETKEQVIADAKIQIENMMRRLRVLNVEENIFAPELPPRTAAENFTTEIARIVNGERAWPALYKHLSAALREAERLTPVSKLTDEESGETD